jgi:hypothetical protein
MGELVLEFGRLGLVYLHLIACCVALGLVLKSDAVMVWDMLRGDQAATAAHLRQMDGLKTVVMVALGVLWATGASICALDAIGKGGGLHYFANPKLQTKILIVAALTLNGVVLHNLVLPSLQKAGSMLRLRGSQLLTACFAGSVSGVSWLYAAFFGVGRPLSWKYSLLQLTATWPVLIAAGFVGMLALVAFCRSRERSYQGALA